MQPYLAEGCTKLFSTKLQRHAPQQISQFQNTEALQFLENKLTNLEQTKKGISLSRKAKEKT